MNTADISAFWDITFAGLGEKSLITGSPNRTERRFLFGGADGRYYIAEGYNLAKKSAQIRQNLLGAHIALGVGADAEQLDLHIRQNHGNVSKQTDIGIGSNAESCLEGVSALIGVSVLAFKQIAYGDSCPLSNDFCNVFFKYLKIF